MENQRLFIWIAFAAVAWLTWQAWVQDYHQPPVTQQPAAASQTADAPRPVPADIPGLPDQAEAVAVPQGDPDLGRLIPIVTDVLSLKLDTRGADLVSALLPEYPVKKDRPDLPVQLLNP